MLCPMDQQAFQQFVDPHKPHRQGDLRPSIVELPEFIFEDDPCLQPAVNVDLQFVPRLRQVNDGIDSVPKHGKTHPAERLHHVEGAQRNVVFTSSFLQHVDLCEQWLESDHVDRFGQVVIHPIAFAIKKDDQFKRSHLEPCTCISYMSTLKT